MIIFNQNRKQAIGIAHYNQSHTTELMNEMANQRCQISNRWNARVLLNSSDLNVNRFGD